jgi:hypothetical protein
LLSISGSEIREFLKSRTSLVGWIVRDIVQDVPHAEVATGLSHFYE